MHRSSAETDRQKEGSRTNLWRECISIAYVARTNWQMDREIDVQGNCMFISLFCAISRRAEIVLARISIGRPMFIEPTGEMTLIAQRVGGNLLDCIAMSQKPRTSALNEGRNDYENDACGGRSSR